MRYINFLDFRGLRCVEKHTYFSWTKFSAIHLMHLFLFVNGVEWLNEQIENITTDRDAVDGDTEELQRLKAMKDRYSSNFIAIVYSPEHILDCVELPLCGYTCWMGIEKEMPIVEVPLALILPPILDSDDAAWMLANILMKCSCVRALHGGCKDEMNCEEQLQIIEKVITWSERTRDYLQDALRRHEESIKEFVDICVPVEIAHFLAYDGLLSPRSIRYSFYACCCDNIQTFLHKQSNIWYLDNLEIPRFSAENEEELWKSLVSQFKWLEYFLMPAGSERFHLEEFISERKSNWPPLKVFGIFRMKENTLMCSLVDACLCRTEVWEIADVLAVSYSQFNAYFFAQIDCSIQVEKLFRIGVKTLMVSSDNCPSITENDIMEDEFEIKFFSHWGSDELQLRGSLGL